MYKYAESKSIYMQFKLVHCQPVGSDQLSYSALPCKVGVIDGLMTSHVAYLNEHYPQYLHIIQANLEHQIFSSNRN